METICCFSHKKKEEIRGEQMIEKMYAAALRFSLAYRKIVIYDGYLIHF